MTAPQDAVRARRKLTNKLISAHQAERLRPFLLPEIKVIVGDGSLLMGAEAVISAFAAQFADPDFKTYVRTTQTVELDAAGERAAEAGTWVGSWTRGEMSGRYLAVWRKVVGQWALESELYVTLA